MRVRNTTKNQIQLFYASPFPPTFTFPLSVLSRCNDVDDKQLTLLIDYINSLRFTFIHR